LLLLKLDSPLFKFRGVVLAESDSSG